MKTYTYRWKESGTLKANKPVLENIFLFDLVTGRKYLTFRVTDSTVHTFAQGYLTEKDLQQLREREQFTPDRFSRPFGHIVF